MQLMPGRQELIHIRRMEAKIDTRFQTTVLGDGCRRPCPPHWVSVERRCRVLEPFLTPVSFQG